MEKSRLLLQAEIFKAVEKGDAITVDQGATNKITLTVNNATIDGNIDVESSTADSIFNFANVDIIGNVTAGEQKVTLTNSTVSGEINGGNINLTAQLQVMLLLLSMERAMKLGESARIYSGRIG